MEIKEDYIVCDIETEVVNTLPNASQDILKYVGFKYRDKKTLFSYLEKDHIKRCLNFTNYIVGHNFKKYDKIILERYGFKIQYNQVIIDTYEIADNRLKSMLYMDLNQGDRSLRRLCEIFKLEHKKGNFNFDILKKENLTNDEMELLKEYLYGDLDSNDDLFKYFYELFYGFREYMSEENQRKMCWLINKPGSTAYKCVCHMANLPEEYNDIETNTDLYTGGYVSLPYVDFIEG
jgi:hypothetical protein